MNPSQTERTRPAAPEDDPLLRSSQFTPPRRRTPGLLAAGVVGAAIAFGVVSSWYGAPREDATPAAVPAAQDTGPAPSQAAAPDDDGITAAVKAALASDPAIAAAAIEVETQQGVVTLKGAAPDEAVRERAGTLAASSQGVRDVDNRLQVAGATSG